MCVDEEEPMLVLMQAQKCIGLLYGGTVNYSALIKLWDMIHYKEM